jgi:hypothetical protein
LPLPSHGQRGSTPPSSSCNKPAPSPMRLSLSRRPHLISGPHPLLNPAYRRATSHARIGKKRLETHLSSMAKWREDSSGRE